MYYKVVRVPGLESAIVAGQACVKYQEGHTVSPPEWLLKKGYGLCVFETLAQAEKMAEYYHAIYECEGEQELPLPIGYQVPEFAWMGNCQLSEYNWPEGTHTFARVKLTRLVKPAREMHFVNGVHYHPSSGVEFREINEEVICEEKNYHAKIN